MCQTDHIIVALYYGFDTLHCAVFYPASSSAVYTSLPKTPLMDRDVPVLPEISHSFCVPTKEMSNNEEILSKAQYHDLHECKSVYKKKNPFNRTVTE